MAASSAAVLVNYLAVAREGAGILATYSRIDDPSETSEYASRIRQLIEEKEMIEKIKAHASTRFHVEIPSSDPNRPPLHAHWLGEYADEKETAFVVYFAVVTDKFASQAPHSASALLVQLRDNLVAKFSEEIIRGSEGSLTKAAAKLLEALAFTHGLSKIAQVDEALEKVKETMKANIEVALANVEKLEKMESDAAELEEEAKKWKWKAKKVEERMCWQKWKTNIILAVVVIVILIVIIVPTVQAARS